MTLIRGRTVPGRSSCRRSCPGFAGGNLEGGRLQIVDRGIDGLGRLVADEVHVLQIAGVPTVAIGESVAIRRAVRVRRADEDVVRGNKLHPRTDPVAEHGRKAEHVQGHHGDGSFALAKDDRPSGQFTTLHLGKVRYTHAPGHRQERVGRDDADRCADLQLGPGRGHQQGDTDTGDGETLRSWWIAFLSLVP